MAKNNVKSIINTLESKLRKTNITNTDKKEIKEAYTQLADEISQGYQLGQKEVATLRSAFSAYKEEVSAAIASLPEEQQLAFANAIKAASHTQEQEEVKEQEAVVSPDAQTTEENKEEAVVVDEPKEETSEQEAVVVDEQKEETNEQEATAEEQSETTETSEPEPEPLTEEEKNKYLDEIRSDHTLDGYIATIEYPIRRKNIEATLALGPTMAADGTTVEVSAAENQAMALANVDDMLVAMDYCIKNGKEADLDEAIVSRLQGFKMEDINPDNAYALLALADKVKGNTALYDEITNKIATALRNFDNENFGKLSEQDLSKNYMDATKELKDFVPYGEDKKPTLWGYTFTDDKGEVLENKDRSNWNPRRWISGKGNDAQKNEEAILNMARELAAQELAKMPAETDPEKRKEQLNKVMNDKIAMILNSPDGNKTFNQTEIAARMAVSHTKAETFRNRVTQKFKNSKWGKDITARLQKLDKQLTDTYGKKYVTAKKYTKMLGKIGLESVKSSAMFAVAGLANPVGIPALIAYNTVKQWKKMKDQLTDPSISKAKKCAMLLGAGMTTTLGMVTAATGLGAATSALGLDTPAMIQTLTNAGGALGIAGRTAVSTVAATIPNWVEKASIHFKKNGLKKQMANLGEDGKPKPEVLAAYNQKVTELQDKIAQTQAQIGQGGSFKKIVRTFFKMDEKKLAKLNEEMANLQKQAPKDMATLLNEEKALNRQAQMNQDELIGKAIGSGIGIGMAQTQIVPSLINSAIDQLQETTTTAAQSIATAATEHGMNPWAQDDYKAPWLDENHDPTQAPWLKGQDNLMAQADDKSEIHVPYREGVTPDEISSIKAHETNLEAAKAENSSGIEGKSSFAHTLQHLESLGDSRITDTNAVAEGLSEHIGKDANLATIACKMAPHALQQALHIENLPDNNPSSYNMINYLANNDLTPEQTTALNNFIQQNFEGTQFKTENFADYSQTQTHTPTEARHEPPKVERLSLQEEYDRAKQVHTADQQANKNAQMDARTREILNPTNKETDPRILEQYKKMEQDGIKFESTNLDPERRGTIGSSQTQQQSAQQTVVVQQPVQQQTEVYVEMTPQLYAQNHGLIYDPVLSNGVNNIGGDNHGGYLGAFINPKDHSVIMIPNDPVHDKPFTYKTIELARLSQNNNTGAYCHSNHERGMWFDPDKKVTRCWGSGMIAHNNNINKVIAAVNTAGAIYNTVQVLRGRV